MDDDACTLTTEIIVDARSILPSSRSTTTPLGPNISFTSAGIKRSLLNDSDHYRVQSNPSTRATANCWKNFGLPALRKDENGDEFKVIPGFASCKMCYETYKYIDSSTGNLNAHQCPKITASDQRTLTFFIQSPSSNHTKLAAKKKDEVKKVCVNWIANSIRPFRIVSDPDFKTLIQLSMNIGICNSFSD